MYKRLFVSVLSEKDYNNYIFANHSANNKWARLHKLFSYIYVDEFWSDYKEQYNSSIQCRCFETDCVRSL